MFMALQTNYKVSIIVFFFLMHETSVLINAHNFVVIHGLLRDLWVESLGWTQVENPLYNKIVLINNPNVQNAISRDVWYIPNLQWATHVKI